MSTNLVQSLRDTATLKQVLPDWLRAECVQAADEIDRLRAEVEALRTWIEEEGRRTDTCTRNILGTVCSDCRCGKATPNAKVTRADGAEETR